MDGWMDGWMDRWRDRPMKMEKKDNLPKQIKTGAYISHPHRYIPKGKQAGTHTHTHSHTHTYTQTNTHNQIFIPTRPLVLSSNQSPQVDVMLGRTPRIDPSSNKGNFVKAAPILPVLNS